MAEFWFVFLGENATDFFGGRSRSKKVTEVGNCTMWSELLPDLLELIFKRVGVIEYLMCACVCKSWRSVANAFKQEFMVSQEPLLFLKAKHAEEHGYIYDMFNQRLYRVALPHLGGTKCFGFTRGYLILAGWRENTAYIWFVNPFTRHELEFRSPCYPFSHVILASLANSDQEFVVVAFCRFTPYVQFFRSGDVNWTVFGYAEQSWRLIDVAVCRGKIYVLSSYGELWTLNLNSHPPLTRLPVESVATSQLCLHLVSSHEELYIVYFHPAFFPLEIHKLDFERMKWEKVKPQGEDFFLGDFKCCGVIFPNPPLSNDYEHLKKVWYLSYNQQEEICGHHTVLYATESFKCRMQVIPQGWKPPMIFFDPPIWYFPHLSSSVDSVYEH